MKTKSKIEEKKLSKAELEAREKVMKDLKKNKSALVKRYGKDAEAVMYGRATNIAKKMAESENKNKVKEMVRKALMQEADIEVGADRYEGEKDLGQASSLLDDLELMLKRYDWFYYMSDDPRVYKYEEPTKRIAAAMNQLKDLGYGEDAKTLYNQYAPNRGDIDLRMKEGKKEDVDGDGDIDSKDYLAKRDAAIKKAKGDIDESGYREMTDSERSKKQYMDQQLKRLSDLKKRQEDKERLLKLQQKLYQDRMNPLMREDIDLGHEDNEPHMIKAELYRIGKYAMELYAMAEELEETGQEIDFPAWWQAMITDAATKMVKAKHYLDFELKEPAIDAFVDKFTGEKPHMGEPESNMMEGEVTKIDKLASKIAQALKSKENQESSDQNNLKQARKAMNNGDLETAEKLLKPYLEEGFLDRAAAKVKGATSFVSTGLGNIGRSFMGKSLQDPKYAAGISKLGVKAKGLEKKLNDTLNDVEKLFTPAQLSQTPALAQIVTAYKSALKDATQKTIDIASGKMTAGNSNSPSTSKEEPEAEPKTEPSTGKARDEKGRFTSTKTTSTTPKPTSSAKTEPISDEYEVTKDVYTFNGKDFAVQVDKDTKGKFFKNDDGRVMDIATLEKSNQSSKKPKSKVAEDLAEKLAKHLKEDIGRNYPGELDGEYEGKPQKIQGADIYDTLKDILDISNSENDFIRKMTDSLTDETNVLSKSSEEKLRNWYKKNVTN